MPLTLFSIAIIIYILWTIYKTHNIRDVFIKLFGLYIAVRLHVRMGYFLKVGDDYITYNAFLTYVLLFVAFIYLLRKPRRKSYFLYFSFGILAIVITFFSRLLFPYTGDVVLGNWQQFVGSLTGYGFYTNSSYIGHIADRGLLIGYYINLFGLFVFLYISKCITRHQDYLTIAKIIVFFCKVQIIVSIADFIFKNFFNSNFIVQLMTNFFGQYGSQHTALARRGFFYEVVGMTQEASMLNTSFFYSIILLLILNKYYNTAHLDNRNRSRKIMLIIMLTLLILNPSLSAIAYLAVLFIIYLLMFSNKKLHNRKVVFWALVGVGLASVVIYFIDINYAKWGMSDNYLLSRIGMAYSQMKEIYLGGSRIVYSSESIRFSGIFYVLRLISQRPLFGFGIGAITCDSGMITLISNVGIVGTTAWLVCVYNYYSINKPIQAYNVMILILFLIIPNLFLNDYETVTMLIVPIEGILINQGNILSDQMKKKDRPISNIDMVDA